MQLGSILAYKFPQFGGIDGAWQVRDDSNGTGPYIAFWDAKTIGRGMPTDEELTAWAQEYEAAYPAAVLNEARAAGLARFDVAMAAIDAALIRSTTDLVAAMLTPATLTADDDAATVLSADELESSKILFVTLRQVQARNRDLREQVRTAETVEEVQAVEPVTVDRAVLAASWT